MGIFNLFKKNNAKSNETEQQSFDYTVDPLREKILHETFALRDAATAQLGKADEFVLAPLINSSFQGGPTWPNLRQAWKIHRTENATVIISDGLSDPFENDADEEGYEEQGLGIEIYAETTDTIKGSLQESWLFHIVQNASQQAAHSGSFYQLSKELQVFSMELRLPDNLGFSTNEAGRVGVLFGVDNPNINPHFTLPKGIAKLISVKLLNLDELALIIAEGQAGREKLATKFRDSGTHHFSTLM